MDYQLYHGDCLDVLPTLPDSSVDAIITDPPYPYIKREYGYWTEETWLPMMQEVVRQSRRILKPTGSMVIILQPNSEKVGSMRLWLWRFMVWAGEYWNIVQDAYWWNFTQAPSVHVHRDIGLMRPSIKMCLWFGQSNCYRNQDNVLEEESPRSREHSTRGRELKHSPSGYTTRHARTRDAFLERSGVTPFNIIRVCNNGNENANGHGAGTPLKLCDWWTRYICSPGGVVGDWFAGTATTGIAALQNGCDYIGIERFEKYIPVARERLEKAKPVQMRLEAA